MALRDSMRDSAAQFLQPGEQIQAVVGAQTASQWLAALTGIFVFLGFNKYRILAVTPSRILVLDAGKTSMKKARGVVLELPRSTRLGPGTGMWPGRRPPWASRSNGSRTRRRRPGPGHGGHATVDDSQQRLGQHRRPGPA
jgi:hypothetical protein